MTPRLLQAYKLLISTVEYFPNNVDIYFVRHGQTDNNKNRVAQGARATNAPLNINGINQAHDIGKKFEWLTMDLCVTSPAKRAQETFNIVKNYFISDKSNYKTINELQEIDWGVAVDDKAISDEYQMINDKFFKEKKTDFTYKESESLTDVFERGVQALRLTANALHKRLQEKTLTLHDESDKNFRKLNIMITGHGFIFGILLTALIDKKIGLQQKPENGGCKILSFENDTYTLKSL